MESEQGSGRTVPLVEHARTHEGAYATIKALSERYAGDERVKFLYFDNSRGKGNGRRVDRFDKLPVAEH